MNGRLVGRGLRCALALTVLIAVPAAAQTTVKLGTLLPRGSSYYKQLVAMGEKWRDAPGGGVKLVIYPDGTQGGEADMVRRMRFGQLQAGLISAVGLSEIDRGVGGLQFMPLLYRSNEELDYVSERLRSTLEQRLRDKGFEVLYWADGGFIRLFSNRLVTAPADMGKIKLFTWAGGSETAQLLKDAGFNPVPLETNDIGPSLQTGLIDAVCLPPFFALAGQVDLQAPYMLDIGWSPLVGAMVVSKKTWDKLPAETQQSLRASASETGKAIQVDSRRESVSSIEAMKKRGLKVTVPPPDAMRLWENVATNATQKVRGVLVPPEIFDQVLKLVAEFRAQQVPAKR
ncbi:MAG: TRAP transporter substrate-binding protein DctP [Acidobacteriota bacterium]